MRWSGGRGIVLASGLALAAAGLARVARADECKSCGAQHRARFQVESTREVENDWITAIVGVTAEDANPAVLADRVNKDTAWALEQAKSESKVKAKSGGYSTYPINEKGRIVRWQASQQLLLEGSDAAAMTALLGKLQARVQLQSFEFSVSDVTRRKVQEELVTEALTAFRARAALVAKGLGASGYTLDDVSVETGSPGYPVPMMRAEMAMAKSEPGAPPAVEAGTSRVAVTVQGSIVLD
ncbi:MAG TPA: SIMPL domain-containing protein [Myxococcota bacterium]|nr:SIMPL domain-containing protein [Myxococcota bacterium]